ncbi:LPS export ABC transporter periplasmic protein LptC [Acinetobacter sp. ANC 4636]
MDTKTLYIAAIVIGTISGGYYYFSGKSKKLDVDSARNMTYSAKDVKITQTDQQGHVSVRASVDEMAQNKQNNTSQLYNFNATTYSHGKIDATYTASRADGYDDNQKVILSGNVVAHKNTAQGVMTLRTDQLTGYPKTRQLETTHMVTVDSAQSQFISHGLKADLNSGQYEFFNIRGNYAPKS